MEASIIPAVSPSWPEFSSSASNGTYMLTANFAVSGTLNLNANVTIIIAGGRFTGSGTINGNKTIYVAPPIQVFDSTIQFSGTWNLEKVYAENFGDTTGSNAAPAINKAIELANLSGCVVQLLGKKYNITQTINMLGGVMLQGTIYGPTYPQDSLVSLYGTNILMNGNSTVVDIRTTGNDTGDIDCYRFALKYLNLSTNGTGNVISIQSIGQTLTPRSGFFYELSISHTYTNPGYGIYMSGGSYIRFERISLTGGKGIKLNAISTYQEFIWFKQIAINSNSDTYPNPDSCVEINSGNNIYLTEMDANDAQTGFLLKTTTANSLHDIYMERLAAVRCTKGYSFHANQTFITRIKLLDSTAYIRNTTGGIALHFTRDGTTNNISDAVFDTINIDQVGGSGHYIIKEENASLVSGHFLNIRAPGSIYNCTLRANNELTFVNIQKSGVYSGTGTATSRTINLVTNNSPFPGKPAVIVSTNQSSPFKVTTTNTPGGASQLQVVFTNSVSGTVLIYYTLTGYYYS
jgi:hypothetical protein